MRAGKWFLRLAILFVVGSFLVAPPSAHSQRLFVNGGAQIASQSIQSPIAGTNPAVTGGVQLSSSEYLRLRLAGTYQNLYSVEGLMQVHFLGDDEVVNPYLAAGYGYYILSGSDSERGVLPAGLGLEYGFAKNLALNVEVMGRFGVNEVADGNRLKLNVMSALMPGIGITYKPKRIDRRPPGLTPVEGGEMAEGEFKGRSAENEVDSPFQDPVSGSQLAIQKFDLPYTVDSLKQTNPLIVQRDEAAPYEDPGQVPISGSPTLSNDGTMVRLPDGSFIMGLTDEDQLDIQNAGRKKVTVSSFYIDRFEITNEDYREFLNDLSGSERETRLPDSSAWDEAASRANWKTYFYGSERSDYPVVAVTWRDAKEFCKWEGKRLPTEAEWEYAARAGRVGGVYPWAGFSPRDPQGRYLANFNPGRQGQAADGYAFTAPIGSYPPNKWGMHDVAGNVAEWVEDAYTPSYSALSGLDPVYKNTDENRRVVRGGSWASNPFQIGVGVRDFQPKDEASARIGFRCAADVSSIEGSQERLGPGPKPSPQNTPQPGTTQQTGGAGQTGAGGGAQTGQEQPNPQAPPANQGQGGQGQQGGEETPPSGNSGQGGG